MLSNRGQKHAELDLAAGYTKVRGKLYDKRTNPDGLICLSNAENFLMHSTMLEYIQQQCTPSLATTSLTYDEGPFGTKRLRSAMADLVNTHFHPIPASRLSEEHISFVGGVTALNEVLARCLMDEGEGVLLGRPIYGSFRGDWGGVSGCKLVYASFGDVDQFGTGAVECYERALRDAEGKGIKVRALLITNPHNPLGRCYPRATLEALMRFCGKNGLHLISDEIYALSVHEGADEGFTSVLSIEAHDRIDSKSLSVMYGMSKDFAAAGLRLGCLITHNKQLTQAVRSIARFHPAAQVSDAIASRILSDSDFHCQFLRNSQRLLRENKDIAIAALNEAGIPIYGKPSAGFFVWIDLSACLGGIGDGQESLLQREAENQNKLFQAGIEMSTGMAYNDEKPGTFRLLIALERDTLVEACKRLSGFYKENS